MFSPQKQLRMLLAAVVVVPMVVASASAQSQQGSAAFQHRMAAMQRARMRSQAPQAVAQAPVRVAQAQVPARPLTQATSQTAQLAAAQATTQAAPQVLPQAAPQVVPQQLPPTYQQVVTAPAARVARGGYIPRHMRTAQLISQQPLVGSGTRLGSPALGAAGSGTRLGGTVLNAPITGAPVNEVIPTIVSDSVVVDQGTIVHQNAIPGNVVYQGEVIGDGCNTCGDVGGYFQDDCCGRGGCPDGACPDGVPCWFGPLGRALRNGSYFFGATAFRHPAFSLPGQTDLNLDSNFGAYGGFNLGIPLCRLFCGRISGQFGLRSVQSHFGGSDITSNTRDQLFVTAGLYRRVDSGLQAGVVADILSEEFFVESDVTQIRAEVSWAYPNGSAVGFRLATNQQDDITNGSFAGTTFTDFTTTSLDHYRFFLRKVQPSGGWEELYAGWSDDGHGVFGLDIDLPVANYIALEAGAAFYLSDETLPGSNLGSSRVDDSFNLYLGFAFRPQGRAYYRSYDRPLLPVADNGTLILQRN